MTPDAAGSAERETLIEIYDDLRHNLLIAMRGLTEEQARTRSTASQLTLGGLLKHVTLNERGWIDTITAADPEAEFDMEAAAHAYELTAEETFAQWWEEFAAQARRTNAFIREVPDLDAMIPLPRAPGTPSPVTRACAGSCCTCSARPPTTAGTRTSSGRSWTAGTRP